MLMWVLVPMVHTFANSVTRPPLCRQMIFKYFINLLIIPRQIKYAKVFKLLYSPSEYFNVVFSLGMHSEGQVDNSTNI
jgi:hypothetical protein